MSYIEELRAKVDPASDAGEDIHNWMLERACAEVDTLRARLAVADAALASEREVSERHCADAVKLERENAALREALSYERLETALKGVQDDVEEMGSCDIPDGYEELSLEQHTIADACWRHGKECMETAVLNRLYDYSKAALHPATKEGKA